KMPTVLRCIFGTIGVQEVSAADDRFQSIDLENKTDLPLESISGCVVDFIRYHSSDSSVQSTQTCERHLPNQPYSLSLPFRYSFRFSRFNMTLTDRPKHSPSNLETSFTRITYSMESSATSPTALSRSDTRAMQSPFCKKLTQSVAHWVRVLPMLPTNE